MKKKVTVLLFFAALCLAALCIITVLAGDSTLPVITVPSAEMTYAEGGDTSALLEGVKATDNRDGDISSSVRVYDVSPMDDGKTALVTYAVYDSSYNLGKATKLIGYTPLAGTTTEVLADGEDSEEDDTEEAGAGEDSTEEDEDEDETTAEEDTEEPDEGYEDPEMVSTGAPVIKLTTHEVKLAVGGYFYSMGYVEDAVDDIDTREYLYRNMYLEGDYDVNTAGEYELTYYCTDSSGNVSNFAKLMLIIGDTSDDDDDETTED